MPCSTPKSPAPAPSTTSRQATTTSPGRSVAIKPAQAGTPARAGAAPRGQCWVNCCQGEEDQGQAAPQVRAPGTSSGVKRSARAPNEEARKPPARKAASWERARSDLEGGSVTRRQRGAD